MRTAREVSKARKSRLHRTVRLTARASGLLFAAAHGASALESPRTTSRALYRAFLVAHAVHFAAVARYATATGGRGLFPGGRSLQDVGGWRTILGIYAFLAGLALTGQGAVAPTRTASPAVGVPAQVATGLVASMFVGTYLGQLVHSRWYLVPALLIGVTAAANITAPRRA